MNARFTELVCAMALGCCLAGGVRAESLTPESEYVPGAGGTLLAVDAWLARDSASARMPAIVQFTRYWRSFRNSSGNVEHPPVVDFFAQAGYAVLIVDVRGTGASFGSRDAEFSDAEVADFAKVFDWIIAQPWSNGRIATLGSSYLGNTSELAAMTRHPALRAVVPRFSDFSEYRHAVRPGGVRNAVIATAWPTFVTALDRNDACGAFMGTSQPNCAPQAPWIRGVRPVGSDEKILDAAIAEHRNNVDLTRVLQAIVYSDDSFHRDGRTEVTLDSVSPIGRRQRIDDARVPAYHWASWFDGGTAEGVLARFASYRTPINIIIGPWAHGGGSRANPAGSEPIEAGAALGAVEQLEDIRSFLDPLMKTNTVGNTRMSRRIRYFTLGIDEWRATDTWPPEGTRTRRWFLSKNAELSEQSATGSDSYQVDFTATSGRNNRWHTQLGVPVMYPDRSIADRKLLSYTSAPLPHGVEITGSPVARVVLAPSQSDGTLFAYVESVAPDGRVTYLTEGILRFRFGRRPADPSSSPVHDFTRGEAQSVKPGEPIELTFSLNPISVVLPKGHRIRLALAGADADTFERLPEGNASLSWLVQRDASFVDLPMRDRP